MASSVPLVTNGDEHDLSDNSYDSEEEDVYWEYPGTDIQTDRPSITMPSLISTEDIKDATYRKFPQIRDVKSKCNWKHALTSQLPFFFAISFPCFFYHGVFVRSRQRS